MEPPPETFKRLEDVGKKYKYWDNLKREMQIFLCTDDKKFADIKSKLARASTKSETAIVSLVAAGVAGSLGVAAGALVPVCALLLLVVVKVGKEAFCQSLELPTYVVEAAVKSKAKKGKTRSGK